MKRIILISLMMSAKLTFGQIINPHCTELTVENIVMDDDTANLMKVTISNSCTTCTLNACIYVEVRVIETVFPFDTIASSNCFCGISNNGDIITYALVSTVATLPPLSNIRVSFPCGSGGGCDTVPFSATLGINTNVTSDKYYVFPNPTGNELNIQINSSEIFHFILYNSLGEKIIDKPLLNKKSTVDLSSYSNDIYFYKLTYNEQLIKSGKIMKQ